MPWPSWLRHSDFSNTCVTWQTTFTNISAKGMGPSPKGTASDGSLNSLLPLLRSEESQQSCYANLADLAEQMAHLCAPQGRSREQLKTGQLPWSTVAPMDLLYFLGPICEIALEVQDGAAERAVGIVDRVLLHFQDFGCERFRCCSKLRSILCFHLYICSDIPSVFLVRFAF